MDNSPGHCCWVGGLHGRDGGGGDFRREQALQHIGQGDDAVRSASDSDDREVGTRAAHGRERGVQRGCAVEGEHRAVGYDGLGFHFLVGNGAGMSDGQIHVGYRWMDQLDGAQLAGLTGSAKGIIEVCLIGDGDRRPFGEDQLQRAAQLVSGLAQELGIAPENIQLHQDLAQTSSPGRLFPRQAFEDLLASMR